MKKRFDAAVCAIFAVLGMLVLLLAIVGGIVALCRATEKEDTAATAPAAWTLAEPAGEFMAPAEDAPDEAQRSLDAILEKCQVVPDCYIVAYAPELVAGWRPEYKSDTGLYLTSSGMWCGLYHTVATDPAVIPTGATVIIDGEVYVAADTGVKGKVIDVMVDVETALTYGARKADVYWCME